MKTSIELFGHRGNIALYQPENPENVGSIIRLCDCFEFDLHIIEPMGFIFNSPERNSNLSEFLNDSTVKNKRLDYNTNITLYDSFEHFYDKWKNHRIVLFTPHTDSNITNFEFDKNDILLFGRESIGVPVDIASQCSNMIKFNISKRSRSLNLATSVGIGLYHYSIQSF